MTATNAILSAAVLASSATASASEWTVDTAHTTAQFSVRHMMVSTVRGQFEKVTGTIVLDDKTQLPTKIEVSIDPASIMTREAKRDAHLRSPDFFDVAKFPAMTFRSTKIEPGDGGKLKVTGDLAMHGVSKPVTLLADAVTPPQKNPSGMTVRGVSATGKLNRKDWGLGWNLALEAGGVLVGEEITLQLDAELIAKAPAAAASN